MEFEFSQHAKRRLQQRRIRREDAEEAVLSPDHWEYGSQGEINAFKAFPAFRLKVSYIHQHTRIFVITVIRLRK
jgi:hypothetical protein